MATRRRATREYETQAEINHAIQRYIDLGNNAEERRDEAPYESSEYWRQHDIAIDWYTKAEALMPGGAYWRAKAIAEGRAFHKRR